jgi:peroxiredoxin
MILFALALGSFFVAVGCWLGYQLLTQNGRILIRLEALERAFGRLALQPSGAGVGEHDAEDAASRNADRSLRKSRLKRDGLAPGTPAPDFHVPRVDGRELSLSEFRGRPVLLVFSDPNCGPCDALAPRLERRARTEDVAVVMVSRGDLAANRAKVAQHRLTIPVGLQRHWEVSREYAMFATPIGYWIDEEGIVAAPVAIGPDAILALLSQAGSSRGGLFHALNDTYTSFSQEGIRSWNIDSIR